jgi:VWFA-related protein
MRYFKVACIGILAVAAIAQDQSVFHANTRLVEVEVVVRDGKGPVAGLKQEDFQLFDNGKLQKIGTFNVVTSKSAATAISGAPLAATSTTTSPARAESPVTATVLFINNLAIGFSDQVQAEKRVAEVFHKLPPREPTAVYVLNQKLRILTDFTDDPVRIAKALDSAWGEQPQPLDPYNPIPPVYPALQQMANELASLPGRKNLLWFANFFPFFRQNSKYPVAYYAMLKTIKALNSANVAVYPIRATGVAGPPAFSARGRGVPPIGVNLAQGPSGIDGLFWADNTGGTAAQNTDVGFAALRALDDSQVAYSLGFYPENLDGTYHDLKVKVDRKGVDVRSRVGYLASVPADLSETTVGAATMQVPYFYTGTDRARVRLALDIVPAGMTFQRKGNVFRGQMDVTGTTLHTDGGQASRFEESLNVDFDNRESADAFTRAPFHYEHEFLLLAGSYVVQMTVGVGQTKNKLTVPLNIEPWHEDAFGIGGIAFCTEGETADGGTPLAAGGKEFVTTGRTRFKHGDRIYLYTEVYDPQLTQARAPSLALEYRVVDRTTGELKKDSGMAGINSYVRPGNSVIPFATALPVDALPPGGYRLEIRTTHSSGPDVVTRSTDFEIE